MLHNKKVERVVPFFKPTIDEEEFKLVQSVLQTDVSNSSKVEELENEIASFIGARYTIATNNATSALHLALSAMDLKRADKVLMSVNSFVNLPETVRHFDAEPIFVDIESDGYNIDVDKLEDYLKKNNSKKLRAVIVSFVAGAIPDLKRLYEIGKSYDVLIIEDATSALGAMYNDQMVGSLGADMTIFSTNYSNSKTALSRGGFIVTNNEELANQAKLLRTHAINSSYDMYGNLDYIYDVVDIGYKYDMTELEAAFNLAQFYKTNSFCERRQEIAGIYNEKLQGLKHIKLPVYDEEQIYTQYIIKVSKNRDAFARALKEEGVSTGLHYIPLHLLTYYKKKYKLKITAYGNALSNYGQILSLPIYPSMSDEDVEYVCSKVKSISSSWV
ncbi:MAG: DegT/DnrJ/EryC1/StrS aminotransferase family protein [Campylobacterales bacterium]|nr:DegT/DnrJ/EryC1/StrS aminotransferase family protein [Campylobacterales bacterium]